MVRRRSSLLFRDELTQLVDNVEDIHIWSEGPQTDNNLVLGHDESNKSDFIISGTNNKIIEAITGAQQGGGWISGLIKLCLTSCL